MQSVTITDIPNVENLTSVTVNLQEMLVELIYKGYQHRPYLPDLHVSGPDAARYDGELDDPDHPRLPDGPEGAYQTSHRPRPVKDNPQA